MRYWYPLSMPTIGDEEIDAVTAVLRSGRTTMGAKVEEFEERFAQYVGAYHAVMVNSGSSADLLMAYATRRGLGDEVLIPAVTWPTHVWSFVMAEYRVRFVDVDGLNTNAAIIDKAADENTRAISLVHLMGIPTTVRNYPGVSITEDCCEALGAEPLATHTSSWSFFFSHHMTTMEGGMVTTNSPELASSLRSLRSHGWARHAGRDPYEFVGPGFNLRPTEVAAAIGLVQLDRLPHFNKIRAANHQIFTDILEECPGVRMPTVPIGVTPSWFGLPFFAEDRDGLAKHLQASGVETRPILAGNLLRQPAFAAWPRQELPGADRVHDHGLYVGLHPLENSGVDQVAGLIREFCG